ncbi:hypothetical protein T4E_3122 [Trichinella pseudospiralis]|uniref:Uncharacterized protein n=1 Tax=Trichinella pseudospiralis TaxID=6337 RepID=A0A0V0Y8Y3_TRIPS|nr:hypothetical protein T4E_3122 [Trichinella pseudospiralis]
MVDFKFKVLENLFLFFPPGVLFVPELVEIPFCFFSIFLWPWLRCSEELEQAIFVSSLRNGIASLRRNTYF